MPAPKGHNFAKGRPKGVPNKSTDSMRNALADFFNRNAEHLDALFHQIRAENPREAFKAVMEVAPYVMPKKAAIEHTGKDGGAIEVVASVKYKGIDE